jgi:hypothetical protein
MGEVVPVVERMLALWNGEEVDPSTVYAPRCVENDGEDVFDPEDVVPRIAMLRAASPDLRFEVAAAFSAGRDVVRLRASGTHAESLVTPIGTIEGTGRSFAMTGIEVFEVRDDRIVSVWTAWDWGAHDLCATAMMLCRVGPSSHAVTRFAMFSRYSGEKRLWPDKPRGPESEDTPGVRQLRTSQW